MVDSFKGLTVLDAGCGEGKNAAFLASRGASVRAVDVSRFAISNGRTLWPTADQPKWEIADIRTMCLEGDAFDVVIAYGLLHCLGNLQEISEVVASLQRATKRGGYHVVCALNDRRELDRRAHPDFDPCLVPHSFYLGAYANWKVLHASDLDLTEAHPHNKIPHTHSVTRILARNDI